MIKENCSGCETRDSRFGTAGKHVVQEPGRLKHCVSMGPSAASPSKFLKMRFREVDLTWV
jgi:hypothetical protein